MIKQLSILKLLLIACALLFAYDATGTSSYSWKKIEKLYGQKRYERVLEEIKVLENARFGKNGRLNFSLRNNAAYYHYKLSSRIHLKRYVSIKEAIGLYERLLTLDSTRYYTSQPHYELFREHLRKTSEVTMRRNQIAITRKLVDALAQYGDTTWVYKSVYPKRELLHLANKVTLREYLKNYDYSQIDKKALTVKKQSSIENQAWALTKDYSYDFEKIRSIYIWIVHNITYDYSYSIYDGDLTFKKNTGVCQGYSILFKLMCEAADLKVFIVTGIADNGRKVDGHAWNAVEIEGELFLLDSTWGSGQKYAVDYYYLISERELAKTHKKEKMY